MRFYIFHIQVFYKILNLFLCNVLQILRRYSPTLSSFSAFSVFPSIIHVLNHDYDFRQKLWYIYCCLVLIYVCSVLFFQFCTNYFVHFCFVTVGFPFTLPFFGYFNKLEINFVALMFHI
jgi:hypothetical protein